MRHPAAHTLLLLALAAMLAAGCGPADRRQKILDARARFNVEILNWAQEPAGDLNVSTRVTGPPSSPLEQLTVRFDLLDASGGSVGEHWYTYDLSRVPRGGPSDILVRIPSPGVQVDGLSVSLVYTPNEDEAAQMPELGTGP